MQHTPNYIMRQLWANASQACGQEITINRDFLYNMLIHMANEAFEDGYSLGVEHTLKDQIGELPIGSNFSDVQKIWGMK